MMRRLTFFMTPFMLLAILVSVTGCGKRGELRLPDEPSPSAPLWEQPDG